MWKRPQTFLRICVSSYKYSLIFCFSLIFPRITIIKIFLSHFISSYSTGILVFLIYVLRKHGVPDNFLFFIFHEEINLCFYKSIKPFSAVWIPGCMNTMNWVFPPSAIRNMMQSCCRLTHKEWLGEALSDSVFLRCLPSFWCEAGAFRVNSRAIQLMSLWNDRTSKYFGGLKQSPNNVIKVGFLAPEPAGIKRLIASMPVSPV